MKTKTLLLLFLMTTFFAFSQDRKMRKADEHYDNLAYFDAIEIYKKVAQKGFKSKELFQKLGNAYYFNGQLAEAYKWYTELFNMNELNSDTFVTPEYYYRYAQTLKSLGNDSKAEGYLKIFFLLSENEIRVKLYSENKNYLEEIKTNSGRYTLETIGINSAYSDYGAAFYKTSFVFVSSRLNFKGNDRINKWDNQAYSRLFFAQEDNQGRFGEPQLFSEKLNTKFNEATPVFTKDGKTVYFTGNNYYKGKIRKNSEGVILLKIYKATYKDGDWKDITELPFNSNEYSVAHPALSPDETILYFASDMPGTIGQSDLFKVKIYENNSYGKPENLGPTINTEGRETFPFVSDENEMYFASDGHPGLGGLDVFWSQINTKGSFSKVVNVGKPVNSSFDDFSYLINAQTRKGFFSSNRNTGLGFDDIYKFTENKRLISNFNKSFYINVSNKNTNLPIDKAEISLFDEKMNLINKALSDSLGNVKIDTIKVNKRYYILAVKENFETVEEKISADDSTEDKPFVISMAPKVQIVSEGEDLAKLLNFRDIYFGTGKAVINSESAVELAKVAEFMKATPNISLEVGAHSDSRYTKSYNLKLSNLRAKATIEWLVKVGGIDPKRLSGKGYGEEHILNKCVDGVPCTAEEHAVNRRSEFIIKEFSKKDF